MKLVVYNYWNFYEGVITFFDFTFYWDVGVPTKIFDCYYKRLVKVCLFNFGFELYFSKTKNGGGVN